MEQNTNELVRVEFNQTALAGLTNDTPRQVALAQSFVVDSPEAQAIAAGYRRDFKTRVGAIKDWFKPLKDAVNQQVAILRTKEKDALDPLEQAIKILSDKDIAYSTEQQRKADEERRRLEEIEKRRIEDERIANAETLQSYGMDDAAERELSTPVEAPVVHVEANVAKVAGQSYSTDYAAEEEDVLLLAAFVVANPAHRNLLKSNGPACNALARAMKDAFNIPGLRLKKTPRITDRFKR